MEQDKEIHGKDKRLEYWDNIKGILIFLVVIGHFFYDLSSKNNILLNITTFIYFFHMPAFVFVSGYFCKDKVNFSKLKKYLIFYLVGNTCTMFIVYIFMNGKIKILEPYYSYWYLLALVVWRATINHLKKVKGILWIAIFIALLAGFSQQINNIFALSRIVCFFPFFILGVKYREKEIYDITKKYKMLLMICSVILFFYTVFCITMLFKEISLSDLQMFPYTYNTGIINRIIIFAIASIMIVILLSITQNRKIWILTKCGMNSLYILLYHRVFVLFFSKVWNFTDNTLLTITVTFILSIIIIVLFGSNTVKNITEQLYEKIFNQKGNKKILFRQKVLKVAILVIITCIFILPMYNNLKTNQDGIDTIKGTEDKMYDILSDEEKQKIDNSFSILFTGDLILLQEQVKRGYNSAEENYNYDDIFEYTNRYIQKSDLSIGVLEGPMAGGEVGYTNSDFNDNIEIKLNFPDQFGKAIKKSGFDMVTVANNHILDKGIDGATRTVNELRKLGIAYSGFYENDADKNNANIIEKEDLKIGVLSYTYGMNYWSESEAVKQSNVPVIVSKESEHFEYVKSKVLEDFRKVKEKNPDTIIVLPHYGTQFSHDVDEFQNTWNKIFLEAGADIIIGDHSHSVQPIEITKNSDNEDAIIVNSLGNFVNSYREFDGDATAMIEIYLDKNNGKLIASSLIPMWTQAKLKGNYRAIPIQDIFYNDKLKDEISTYEMNRVEDVFEITTEVMLGEALKMDKARRRIYYTTTGYKRDRVEPIEVNYDSEISKLINSSNSICFIGDSITEGTKNGGYAWYEPLINSFNKKEVINISKGGATSKTILEFVRSNNQKCDLCVIAIGANDVRYRDSKICAMNELEYINNIQLITESIKNKNNAKFVFIAPWNSLENDNNSKLENTEKEKCMERYSEKLKRFCEENDYLYLNPNRTIIEVLSKESYHKYMIDYIHPNSEDGIELYSKAVQEAAIQK